MLSILIIQMLSLYIGIYVYSHKIIYKIVIIKDEIYKCII